jgi:hypothetical protein
MRRGPLLHEEGLLRDPNIAPGFFESVAETDGARRPSYRRQRAQETLTQRSEMAGPAAGETPSWTSEGAFLGSFAAGASGQGEQSYYTSQRSGAPYRRPNEAAIREDSGRGRNDLRSDY